MLKSISKVILPVLILTLLFLTPGAAMQGVRDGVQLWANAVLPALLPFFVMTQLLQACGALNLVSPLLRPFCRLLRLPDALGGLLAAGWLSGAPNGARLFSEASEDSAAAARFSAAATVTSPLFLIGTAGQLLGSPALGALVYGIQFLGALCNGVLWRGYGAQTSSRASAPSGTDSGLFTALPDALRSSCLSVLFIGAAIAFFSAITASLRAIGVEAALERILLFAIPADAVQPLLAGFFEVSQGTKLAAQSNLSLSLRLSMLCAFASFGGLSVICQAQVFLAQRVKFSIYFAQRVTHAALSFLLCRAVCLLFDGALPAMSAPQAALQAFPTHPQALPALLLCLAFSLVPWHNTRTRRLQLSRDMSKGR